MIEWIIRRSVANRFLVMMGRCFSVFGELDHHQYPVDALPDLSDVQVIVKTSYPGQAPQIVENQVTYPLTTTMLSVPGAKICAWFLAVWRFLRVRHFRRWYRSLLGALARTGVPQPVQGKLPAGVSAEMGPDATGVGWIFEYALVDRSGKHDLAELRSLQDWF